MVYILISISQVKKKKVKAWISYLDRSQSCVLEAQSEPGGRASQHASSLPQGHVGGVCMGVVGRGEEWVSLGVPTQAW